MLVLNPILHLNTVWWRVKPSPSDIPLCPTGFHSRPVFSVQTRLGYTRRWKGSNVSHAMTITPATLLPHRVHVCTYACMRVYVYMYLKVCNTVIRYLVANHSRMRGKTNIIADASIKRHRNNAFRLFHEIFKRNFKLNQSCTKSRKPRGKNRAKQRRLRSSSTRFFIFRTTIRSRGSYVTFDSLMCANTIDAYFKR